MHQHTVAFTVFGVGVGDALALALACHLDERDSSVIARNLTAT